MLRALHTYEHLDIPFYGLHRGTVGFLQNPFEIEGLIERLNAAKKITIHPLRMLAVDKNGVEHNCLGYNEVALFRESRLTAKIKIMVDNVVRLEELSCDGVLIATPAGSTAYNLSAKGPILPLFSDLLAITPISAFRPRRWPGAILPCGVDIHLEILDAEDRPVSATADSAEVRDVVRVSIHESRTVSRTLMFDPGQSLEEKILQEQFQS